MTDLPINKDGILLYYDSFPRYVNDICHMVMMFGGHDNRKFSIAIFFKKESIIKLSESIDIYEEAWKEFGRLTRDPYKLLKN